MKRLTIFAGLILVFFLLSSVVYAQRGAGGGNDGGGRGGNGTPQAFPTRDPNTTPFALPTRDPDATPFVLPTDWTSISLPTDLPSQEELEALIEAAELPFNLESLNLPASSQEAYSALVAFGQTYLGVYLNPLYAGTLDSTTIGSNSGQVSQEVPTEIQTISSEAPAELEQILATASGLAYWGVFDTGAAVVYTSSECNSANCSVTMDNLQVTLTSGSLGVYSLYRQAVVNDAGTAQALLLNTYPALTAYSLTTYPISSGYAYMGTSYLDGQIVAFIGGVMPSQNGQTLVYVAYGVGEAYVNILR